MSALTDETLLAQCESSEQALETMIRRHFRLVTACAHSFFLVGAEESDLVQEGLIGLLSAIRSFDPAQDVSFPAYAKLCIRRRMISAVRAANAEKNAPLNDSVPLESYNKETQFDDPESAFLSKEHIEALMAQLEAQLSPLEQSVLRLYLDGYAAQEIALTLHRTPKSVENAIQRIRNKAAKTFPRR